MKSPEEFMPAIEGCLQNAERLISAAHISAVFSGNPTLLEALDLILPNATESMSVQTLRLQPFIATHRNQISEEPFFYLRNGSEAPRTLRWFPWSATSSMKLFVLMLPGAHIFCNMWVKRQFLRPEPRGLSSTRAF
jgi:hypothetical protein